MTNEDYGIHFKQKIMKVQVEFAIGVQKDEKTSFGLFANWLQLPRSLKISRCFLIGSLNQLQGEQFLDNPVITRA